MTVRTMIPTGGSDGSDGDDADDEDGESMYDAVETWMTMIKLNKAMSKVLRHGMKNKEDDEDEKVEEDGNRAVIFHFYQ